MHLDVDFDEDALNRACDQIQVALEKNNYPSREDAAFVLAAVAAAGQSGQYLDTVTPELLGASIARVILRYGEASSGRAADPTLIRNRLIIGFDRSLH